MGSLLKKILRPALSVLAAIWMSTSGVAIAAPAPPPDDGAASSGDEVKLEPGVLSAKTLLEEMLARRYGTEIATFIDKAKFTVSARVELKRKSGQTGTEKQAEPATGEEAEESGEELIPADLRLGQLDLDQILQSLDSEPLDSVIKSHLSLYQLERIQISVGLNSDLAPTVKQEAQKWLSERLKQEFGQIASGTVALINEARERPAPEKTWVDWLRELQQVAGQLVLALAALFAVLLWKLMGSRDAAMARDALAKTSQAPSSAPAPSVSAPAQAQAQAQSATKPEGRAKPDEESSLEREDVGAIEMEISSLSQRMESIIKGLNGLKRPVSVLVQSWCKAGEDGLLKTAAFLDVAAGTPTDIQVPNDVSEQLSAAFGRMADLPRQERRTVLRKVYWDLMAYRSLGPAGVERPFNYLDGTGASAVSQILMDQNPRLRVLTVLYMPSNIRERYLNSLAPETRLELVLEAFRMENVSGSEVRSLDGDLRAKVAALGAGGEGAQSIVPLLGKLVRSMSAADELTILKGLSGRAAELGESWENFKRSYASLAFASEWPEEKQAAFFSDAAPDEVLAVLRCFPSWKDALLKLVAPMTAEVVGDELSRVQEGLSKQDQSALATLRERLNAEVRAGRFDLEEIFPMKNANAGGRQARAA